MFIAASFRHVAATQGEHQQADWDIDEKGVTPAETRDIRRDQPTAKHLTDNKRNTANAAVQTDSASMSCSFQRHMQGREDLRHNQRRTGPLQRSRGQQCANRVSQAAQQRSQAKNRHAPHKQAPTAVVIAKLAAHRQTHGERNAVERDDKLQLRGAGVQRRGD